LRRYHANNPDVYETLIQIETALFSHRVEKKKEEDEKKKREQERKAKTQPRAQPSASRRGSYKEVIQRPTFQVK
tara:strand:+ start:1493 stop:1714 length:222 start_codon:yes stop_codon:yes gene_type:complete